ncbi:hypothetical protein AL713_15960 [Clostridium botulinum]|uniref:hypothetical protein n=1 Tax=Clostridium botulinum TaxID=1491 RepID=UPI00099B882A|nr:hypothetical protein [Clostridium botulinum]OPD29596.1 hypothetical protein AL713_15960 [Clostridium botulinum]HCL4559285.1 hypothetical protein [Clostridium botulinum]HCL4570057.1 hypothetical protein [Clostridium botulinum]HCL4584873.1 hypothetical protein [Clostridium botulinum]
MEDIDEWMKLDDKEAIVMKLFHEGYKVVEVESICKSYCGGEPSGTVVFKKGDDKRSISLEGRLFDEMWKEINS